ncbi:DNA-binding response regulator [Putridiphycobacter roseus]|uniref:DNA-binding response regulator n=1 Tax=Putridiphycobacter roseus TaxID=2219161 RepID=A0A2W1MY55_9FLAO|nr:LytTR family DNA-binding domain-containing protein [Putridiphycobacter roseus]PZE16120.1 DNA-binding response regulator [Putridiphycobacter roseus]
MNVLIIEDESRAAIRLEKLLGMLAPHFKIIAKLETVRESITFLQTTKVDLIFSDIQLADGLSFEIYSQISVDCPIVFTTAYDQYAIIAFETNGIDYLLKPIAEERLKKAINKFEQFQITASPVIDLQNLIQQITKETKTYKSRFMIKVGEKIRSIPITSINAFYSEQKGTYLLTNEGRNYVLDQSLEEIVHLLDPTLYFKINRKIIVNIQAITEIIAHSNSRLKIVIPHLNLVEVVVAREKVKAFKSWIDA